MAHFSATSRRKPEITHNFSVVKNTSVFSFFDTVHESQDGVVGRLTRYGPDDTGFEPRWGKEIFFSL
jgi:hypothetical protein